jgi:DNA-binding NtrC family response regulator
MCCHLNFLPAKPEILLHDRLNGNPDANRRRGLMVDKLLKINALTRLREYQNGKPRWDVGKSDIDCRIFRQPDLDKGYADQRASKGSMAIRGNRGESNAKSRGFGMQERVLVVEDDDSLLEVLSIGLELEGFDVIKADGISRAILEIQKSLPSIVLSDYQLRDGTAFDLLNWLKARDFRIPVIVLTGHARIDLAVEAVKAGAEHFIPKPVDIGLLNTMLRRTLENFRNLQKSVANRLERARYERDPFLGTSPAILALKKSAKRVSEANRTILIQGETGTGKGVMARALHKMGPRSNEAFVDLNCAGLSRELLESELFGHQKGAFTGAIANKIGFLEAANRGTLFLDEIGDMDLQIQAKVLKVVEEKHFYRLGDVQERKADMQIIAATHRDLRKLSEEGQFRSDLYFRINTLLLRIPPLRDRREDIPVITDSLVEQLSSDMKRGPLHISENARTALQNYSWPGNIRELRNVLERAVLLSDDGVIYNTGLEFEAPSDPSTQVNPALANLTLKEVEKLCVIQALAAEGGNIIRSAKRLGIHRSSLYAKIREYGL